MIWDPKGCHIGAGRGQEAAGKQFKHVGSDLPVRFADQFAVWDFGQDVSTPSPDTLIRVPLRTDVQSAVTTRVQARTPPARLPCQLRPLRPLSNQTGHGYMPVVAACRRA